MIEEETKPREQDGDIANNLINKAVELLKSHAGYPYVSISRIERLPTDPKVCSVALTQILLTQLAMGLTDQEEFKKRFVHNEIAIIQLHSGIPMLAEDGVYTHCNPNGPVKSIILPGFFMLSNPDDFKPIIICRNPGVPAADLGKNGTLSIIQGNYYHTVTMAEIAEVIKMTQPDAVKKQ